MFGKEVTGRMFPNRYYFFNKDKHVMFWENTGEEGVYTP